MSVIAERQVAAGMTGNPQTEKSRYVLVMEAFWRCDKFRIRAGSKTCLPLISGMALLDEKGAYPSFGRV